MHEKYLRQFADLVSAGPIVVYTCEPFGNYAATSVTPNVLDLLGFEAHEVVAQSDFWVERVHPDDAPGVFQKLGAIPEKKHFSLEYRVRHKDGTYRWTHDDLFLILDENGKPETILGYWADISDRKNAEEALKRSSAKFRDFAESASDWFWEQDKDLRFTSVNTFRHIPYLKNRAESGLGKTRWELAEVNPDEDPRWQKHIRLLRDQKSFRDFRYSVLDDRGEPHILSVSGTPIFDTTGAFSGYRGTVTDVTELDQTQKANERFLTALDQLPEGLALWDADERLVVCNSHLRKMSGPASPRLQVGVTFEEWTREYVRCGLIPEAAGREDEWIAGRVKNFRSPPASPIEVVRVGRWHALSFQKLPDGSTLQSIFDIHDAKLGEQRFELATSGAGIGVWESSKNYEASFWSDSFYNVMEMARDEKTPSFDSFLSKVHAQDQEMVKSAVNGTDTARNGFALECRIQRSDGTYFWVRLTGEMMKNAHASRWFGALVNIDQQKRADIAKDQFISTVNHELRTPLTSIRGALDLIRSGIFGEFDPEVVNLLTIGKKNTDRLLFLVNDILDVDKLESGQFVFEMEDLSANEILSDALTSNETYAAELGVTLAIHPGDQDCMVNADRNRIQQVLANLISNAAKFSESGSSVEISMKADGDFVVFSVKDFGIGISDDFKPKVFERFAQEDGSDTRKVGGTGLGLAISKSIVEAHGGVLDFESTLGQGTTFFFRLPV